MGPRPRRAGNLVDERSNATQLLARRFSPQYPAGRRPAILMSARIVRRCSGRGRSSQRGVTLLELMIAITLVAGLSTGMLMAMRTSLQTYEKTAKRLESNRRFVKTQQILSDQISAVMPVQGACLGDAGQSIGTPSFLGGAQDTLRLVSSYSIAEGSRGYPQIVEYRVIPEARGSVRLVATERPYTGPQSTIPYCGGTAPPPPGSSFELGARSAT